MNFADDFLERMEPRMQKAYSAMDALEAGAISNPDEGRMVGHYWLRAPGRAPSAEVRKEIEDALQAIKGFAFTVHAAKIYPRKHARFTNILSIGIGGSALGPQFIADALGTTADKMKPYFLDNTDPDGVDRVLARIGNKQRILLRSLFQQRHHRTRNGMLEVAALSESRAHSKACSRYHRSGKQTRRNSKKYGLDC
jgi:glucose-6-phosphate isomerase